MLVMTYSQARQNLSSLLDSVKKNGMAIIKRSDGSTFKIVTVEEKPASVSPFEELASFSSTINSKLRDIPMQSLIEMIHEDQEDRADRILADASGKKPKNFFNILKGAK